MAKGSRKVAVIGPEATPPASKATPVNSWGTKKVSAREMAYPGMRNHRIEIPVSTRSMAMPMEMATPMLIPCRMADWEMEPMETSSTCLTST